MTTATMSTQSVETKNLEQAKHFNFYRNGDRYFAGRRYTWNRRAVRTFEAFLGEVTQCVKLQNGAVRNLYTPSGGHRVKDLSSMEDGGSYVAAGQDSFKPLEYTSIDPRPRARKPINYNDIPPVYHCKRQVSGRIKRAQTQSIIIKCWSNGEDINEAHRILLTPWMQRNWSHVLNACTECLGTELNGAVYKLYTRDGYPIEKLEELEHGGRYVAVPAFKSFKRVDYKDTGMKNLLTSPRLDGRFRSLPPLSRDSKNSTNQSSPVHSQPASENGYAYTKRSRRNHHHPKREEDTVFPAKPIAHKRSSERNRRNHEVNYDKDEGGVFKSKNKSNETKGAEEVKETRDTKTDLPIDQVDAEEVKEEDNYPEPQENGIESANEHSEHLSEDENVRDNKGSGNNGRNDRNSKNGASNHNTQQRNTVAKTNSKRNPQPAPKQAKDDDRNNGRLQRDEDRNNGRPDRRENRSHKDEERKRKEEEQRLKEAKEKSDAKERERREAKEKSDARERERREAKERERREEKEKSDAKERERREAKEKSDARERERKEKERNSKQKGKSPSNKNNGKSSVKSTTSEKSADKEKQEDKAARTIQHHYRGYRSRQQTKPESKQDDSDRYEERDVSPPRWEDRDSTNDRMKEDKAAAKIQAGVRGYQTRKRLKNDRDQTENIPPPRDATPYPRGKTPPSRGTTPPQRETTPVKNTRSREDEAAAKIQGGYRGYKTRKELKAQRDQQRSSTPLENNNVSKIYDQEDLENKAAAKIQAGFRGYKVRKGMKA